MKKLSILLLLVLSIVFLISFVSLAEDKNPYIDFKQIKYFYYIETYVRGRSVQSLGIVQDDLSKYVLSQFKKYFDKMQFPYQKRKLPINALDSWKKEWGRLYVVIWPMGDKSPINYYITIKAGNGLTYFWEKIIFEKAQKEEILVDVINYIDQSIQELAIDFFKIRKKK
jgi:hypothetical protein